MKERHRPWSGAMSNPLEPGVGLGGGVALILAIFLGMVMPF